MTMDEDTKVLKDYLIFTVPHVTVLAGAILGVMMILGVPINVALGLFAVAYGIMLTILGLIIRPHVSGSALYRLMMAFFVGLIGIGIIILFYGG
ncbi:hypothetical protein [Thermococcus camini]|uniref:Membrane protein, conserved n=1 Tax=Thermococcus camini TaxID=2016373 RepID=A0A7G2D4T7_9EURY|nr:hypothetical protein [Thermococcus camini]CAD5243255.1 Membrane protein, conserved [Thermococcus camini]